jgi:hypothetical protein
MNCSVTQSFPDIDLPQCKSSTQARLLRTRKGRPSMVRARNERQSLKFCCAHACFNTIPEKQDVPSSVGPAEAVPEIVDKRRTAFTALAKVLRESALKFT